MLAATWRSRAGHDSTFCLHQSKRLGLGSRRLRPPVKAWSSQRRKYAASAVSPMKEIRYSEGFLEGNTATTVDSVYEAWKQDPKSVHASWQVYFHNLENDRVPIEQPFQPPPILVSLSPRNISTSASPTWDHSSPIIDHMKVQQLVRAYQTWGHQHAKIDPLQLWNKEVPRRKELQLEHYGLSEADLCCEFTLGVGLMPHLAPNQNQGTATTLSDLIATCEYVYCGSMGTEYMHISNREECDWIRSRIETQAPFRCSSEKKTRILNHLIWTVSFERFLSTKFPNDNRFGLDGGESLIPGMQAVIERSADEHGINNIQIGMCHRGRLNALHNVAGKPSESIFNEFNPKSISHWGVPGDVRYHHGSNVDRLTPTGKTVHVSLTPNPSHLESVNPVVMGKTRAIQEKQQRDWTKGSSMMLNVHSDASFAAQGVVYETIGFAKLPGYSTGGTVRIIVNNQIGFTTDVSAARSTPYCSDIAKILDAPVFHVNGDDVEAVCFACELAADYRARFQKDCVVDIVCYRRNGHNEKDQPLFTQPSMYERVAKQIPLLEQYEAKLIQEGIKSRPQIDGVKQEVWNKLSQALEKSNSQDYKPESKECLMEAWENMKSPMELSTQVLSPKPTAVDQQMIEMVGQQLGKDALPEGFQLHRSLERVLSRRKQTIDKGQHLDWPTAEALAFGSLCVEGYHVRVSGQDVERGTFSQRHAVLHDQTSGCDRIYTPLSHIHDSQGRFTITNSPLSEYGVLGYEYGYSLADPNDLVMWEAQFGDFANHAQCIIDQYIASAESKWLQRSGIVLSLPHGYDGQGPEHSSARLERFLQLCNEDSRYFPSPQQLERQHQEANIQIVCMTSPANLFHALRRQVHRDFRKPRSSIEEFIGDSKFQPIIPDTQHCQLIRGLEGIKRVIYCSGQVYAALAKHRDAQEIKDMAITRVEELHPFPWAQIKEDLDRYPNATDIVWCQEEPLNGGAWSHVMPRFETIFKSTVHHQGKRVRFAGRDPTASVATGFKALHAAEELRLVQDAFFSICHEEGVSN